MIIPEFEKFEIPERCVNCPSQLTFARKIEAIRLASAFLADQFLDHLTGDFADQLTNDIGEIFDEETADTLLATMRQKASETLDHGDEVEGELITQSETLARSCDSGPLSLRATAKDGREYTVTICTSPYIYLVNSDPQITEATVQVRTR